MIANVGFIDGCTGCYEPWHPTKPAGRPCQPVLHRHLHVGTGPAPSRVPQEFMGKALQLPITMFLGKCGMFYWLMGGAAGSCSQVRAPRVPWVAAGVGQGSHTPVAGGFSPPKGIFPKPTYLNIHPGAFWARRERDEGEKSLVLSQGSGCFSSSIQSFHLFFMRSSRGVHSSCPIRRTPGKVKQNICTLCSVQSE